MPSLPWQKKTGQIDAVLLLGVRKELEDRYSRPLCGKEFIYRSAALGVLTRDRVGDLLRRLSWYREDDRDQLYPRMGLIVCILITINFQRWNDFKSIFFTQQSGSSVPRFTDKDLPLLDVGVLPSYLQESFQRQQYTFLPVVIEKDTHRDHDVLMRLPILKEEPITGGGAQGDVDKVYIEKGYLQFGPTTHNSSVQIMARKRITRGTRRGLQSFETERKNLEQFKKSLTDHKNIMQSFASFVHGPDFVILSEWAEGRDLHHFLYRPDQIMNDYFRRSARFSPHNLFVEAYSLAEALDFLHHHMVNNQGARYKCAHLDLKPENILVCIPEFGNPADTPVGRWKITDFGLSNVELSVARGELVAIPPAAENVGGLAPGTLLGELSLRPLRRGPGPFQPPEVRNADDPKISTRRDVWSFGCILAMVLAFALGGPEEVTFQQQCRSEGADDYFYVRNTRRVNNNPFWNSGTGWVDAIVKPDIRSWLVDRAPGIAIQHAGWVRFCSDLVLRLLEVDVVRRPEMIQAKTDLRALLSYTNVQARIRVWDFDASTLAPEPVPSIPDMQITGDTNSVDNPDPYVGVATNSSPSSIPASPSSPSKGSFSITTTKSDPASRYIKLQTIHRCRSASLCPSGLSAVFLWDAALLVYDLSGVTDNSSLWQESPPRAFNMSADQMPLSVCHIPASDGYTCVTIAVDGLYLAVLESARPSTYAIRVYSRASMAVGSQLKFSRRVSLPLSSAPDDIKISAKGFCLIRFSTRIQLVTLDQSGDIPIRNGNVMGFDFTGDGSAFCVWVRDGNQHFWSIWDSTLKQIGVPIMHRFDSSSRPSAREAFLFPFHGYPRFVACDKHGNVFLIRADSGGDRVQRLGHTENVFSGLVLPDDTAFLLVRASEYSNQKLQKINLSSMGDRASFRPYEWGVLPKNIEKGVSGVCVRALITDEGGLCLLILLPSGVLLRKTLRQ